MDIEQRICEFCKEPFDFNLRTGKKWAEKTNRGRFCGRQCYYLWRRGQHVSKDTEFKKGHPSRIGHVPSEEVRRKISATLQGKDYDEWSGFSSSERRLEMNKKEYINWRNSIFERDNYTCQSCDRRSGDGYTIKLESHHILRWKDYPELRYEVANGITLCTDCHNITKKSKNMIGVIGADGYVGSTVVRFFSAHYQIIPYDVNGRGNLKDVAMCPLVVVAVPTPMMDSGECDISIVNDVIKKLVSFGFSKDKKKNQILLIKSTVPPGTIDKLIESTKLNIVFSPEFAGESKYWSPYAFDTDMKEMPYYIFGGRDDLTSKVIDFYLPVVGPTKKYLQTEAKTAEMVKYMENCYFAAKVTMCQEFYEICDRMGVDYNKARELWLHDPRINPMHTAVFVDNRGFFGKCFPKDLNAMVSFSQKAGYDPLMFHQVLRSNKYFRSKNEK